MVLSEVVESISQSIAMNEPYTKWVERQILIRHSKINLIYIIKILLRNFTQEMHTTAERYSRYTFYLS